MFCLPRIAFKNTFAIGRMTKRTRAGRHLSDPAAGGRWGLPEVYIALVNSMPDGVNFVDQHSTADAKIKLFRSLFRGRDDVYPRRFESRKTGKSGYAPACGNEWIRGICEKPRIKCADCHHQRFLPITDEVIRCICRDLIQRVNPLSPAYTRCFRTRHVFSSPLISISKAGARTQLRF